MKKLILTTILCLVLSVPVFGETIPVYFDSTPISLSQSPVIKDGSTLVPFRGIFEALNFAVSWDQSTNTITGKSGDNTISLTLGSKVAYVNGVEKKLGVAPQMVNGSTMVPLRFISEAAGYAVEWNNENRYILVGENDKDLVSIYEQTSTYPGGNKGVIRYADLYVINSTGKYSGYNQLMGHPYTGYDIYYKLDGTSAEYAIVPNSSNINLNQSVTWSLNGISYKNTKKELFDFFGDVHSIKGINTDLTSDELEDIFGNIYREWLNYGAGADTCYSLAMTYVQYLSGTYFDKLYESYQMDKLMDEMSKKLMAEEEAEKQAALDYLDGLLSEGEKDAYEKMLAEIDKQNKIDYDKVLEEIENESKDAYDKLLEEINNSK